MQVNECSPGGANHMIIGTDEVLSFRFFELKIDCVLDTRYNPKTDDGELIYIQFINPRANLTEERKA
jgi:hypothetical protein